jgi:hypothetical protein
LFPISFTNTGATKLLTEVHKVAKRNKLIPSTLKIEATGFFEILPTMYNVTWWRVPLTIFAKETQKFLPFPVQSCHRMARMGSLCTIVELKYLVLLNNTKLKVATSGA